MEAPSVGSGSRCNENNPGVTDVSEERREEKEEQRTEDPSSAPLKATGFHPSPTLASIGDKPLESDSVSRQQEEGPKVSLPKSMLVPTSVSNSEKSNPTFLLTQAAHISESASPSATTTANPSTVATMSVSEGEILQRSPPKVTPLTAAIESPASPPSSAPTTPSSTIAPSPASTSKATPSSANVPRKRGVPHIYRDYSAVPDTIGYVRKKTGGVTQPFPEKLHELLERENEPTVISWLPHGRAFLVRKPKEFTQDVMPRYFRQTKLTSFQRQLNLYGFRRITQGADAGAYYHELFLRGRPQLCMRMRRQKVKGTGHKQPADAQTEPNFYAMPPSQAQDEHLAADPSSTDPPAVCQHPPQQVVPEERSVHAEMSPGLQGVHGAAQLLKGIAAGLPASSLSSTAAPFSLGVSAAPPRYTPGSAFYQASSTTSSQPTLVTFTHPPTVHQVLPQPPTYHTTNHAAASFLSHVASSGTPASAPSAAPSSGLWSNLATSSTTPNYGGKGSLENQQQQRTPHGFLTGDEGIEGATNTEAV